MYCRRGTSLVQDSGAHFARKLTETVQYCESSEVLTFRGRVEPASREKIIAVSCLRRSMAIWIWALGVYADRSLRSRSSELEPGRKVQLFAER